MPRSNITKECAKKVRLPWTETEDHMSFVYPASPSVVYAHPQMIQVQEIARNGCSFGILLFLMVGSIIFALYSFLSFFLCALVLRASFMVFTAVGIIKGIALAITYGKAAFNKQWLLTGSVPFKLSALVILPAIYTYLLIFCFGVGSVAIGMLLVSLFFWALFSFHEPARPYKYRTVTRVAY